MENKASEVRAFKPIQLISGNSQKSKSLHMRVQLYFSLLAAAHFSDEWDYGNLSPQKRVFFVQNTKYKKTEILIQMGK